MTEPKRWECRAYNQATGSENKIHDDTVARKYGFRGGLVPGVTVYAYLVHPAVEAWGLDWLTRGTASVVLQKPVYDGDRARVEPKLDGPHAYRGEVIDPDGTVCATGLVSLPEAPPEAPVRRGDPPAPSREARPEATRAALENLRERGLGSLPITWSGERPYDRYTRELQDMPELLRPSEGGFANPAFALGLANWILSANVRLGPWIHAQSEVRNHAAIPLGSSLVVEGRVVDLFDRRGHEFVDLDVGVYLEAGAPALSASHRAIYRLRAEG
jgi:hypothetical protein